eukprot:CAMPEP_0202813328 /NCGR_PEP_ID=MMETSP1389-20130828/4715_1 /ASSEMBLY_ACC=CAM_ASM_000865 /TAXON_ID=302021 /ORGANISM="Rhodomonas sp., Strain CCMP768" /LENGTH=265 /DNA_ID=CAMNT_0049484889 /DNA_START=133 /DNA_END=926 /DNA_ORIENTATION=-
MEADAFVVSTTEESSDGLASQLLELQRENRELKRAAEQRSSLHEDGMALMLEMQRNHNEVIDALRGRIAFLESELEPCRRESEAAVGLQAELEHKTHECDEMTAAFEELERECKKEVENVREALTVELHRERREREEELRQVRLDLRRAVSGHGMARLSLAAARREVAGLKAGVAEAGDEACVLRRVCGVQDQLLASLPGHVTPQGLRLLQQAQRQLRIISRSAPTVPSSFSSAPLHAHRLSMDHDRCTTSVEAVEAEGGAVEGA